MIKIAWWILLAVAILFLCFHLLAKYVWWKQEREEKREAKRIQKMEDDNTREYLQALERWDENAKKWKEYYFKHRPILIDLDNSFSKRFPRQDETENNKINYSDNFWKRYIIWFSVFCLIGAVIVVIELIIKLKGAN